MPCAGIQLLILAGHSDGISFASFSPDGKHIVTASDDQTARVWDAHTGEATADSQPAIRVGSVSAVYSPDGRLILTASADQTARIWDAANGRRNWCSSVITRTRYGPQPSAWMEAALPPQAWIPLSRIWDAQTGALLKSITGHVDSIMSVAFGADGATIVTASADCTAPVRGGMSKPEQNF